MSAPARQALYRMRLDRYRSLLLPLGVWLAISGLAFLFLHLGTEIAEGETRPIDTWVLAAAHRLRAQYPPLSDILRDLSGLGSTISLTLLTVGACGYLWLTSSRLTATAAAASIGGAVVLVELLKAGFGRARPDSALAEFVAAGLSYPSGHTSMSAVVFLTFGTLLARSHERRRERFFIFASAALLTVLVGLSRAGLGVHYATDVLGGWAFGAAWAAAGIVVVRWLDSRSTSS